MSMIEVVVTLAETYPALVKKSGSISLLIKLLILYMAEFEEDEDWHTVDELDEQDYDEEDLHVRAEIGLDRVCQAYKDPKSLFGVLISVVQPLFCHEDWKYRFSALMAISASGEGLFEEMEKNLADVINNFVLPGLRDPNARVRHAACNGAGQIGTDFPKAVHKIYFPMIVNPLLTLLDDHQNPRVQSHAGAALVNLCDNAPKTTVTPFLDILMEKLLLTLQSGKVYVQEQIVMTIAAIADAVEKYFASYYPKIMPLLIGALSSHDTKETRKLKAKILECSTLIIMAVGKELFLPDSKAFIELLLQIQFHIRESDDPRSSYIMVSWTRVCSVLKDHFVPYLHQVMPHLLKTAESRCNVELDRSAQISQIRQQYREEDGWEVYELEDGKIMCLNTANTEDKIEALRLLSCYAEDLKSHFADYALHCLQLAIPLIDYDLNDSLKVAASELISPCLECLFPKPEPNAPIGNNCGINLQQIQEIISKLALEVLKEYQLVDECSKQALVAFYEALDVLAPYFGASILTSDIVMSISKSIYSKAEYMMKYSLQEPQEEDDEDEWEKEDEDGVVELDEEELSDYIFDLSRMVHSLFSLYKQDYLRIFDSFIPLIHMIFYPSEHFPNLFNQRGKQAKFFETTKFGQEYKYCFIQFALCLLDDLFEFGLPYQSNYTNQQLEKIVIQIPQLIYHNDPDVRQAASFGLGTIAMSSSNLASILFDKSIPKMRTMITQPDAKDEENLYATDNLLSALTKWFAYQAPLIFLFNQIQPYASLDRQAFVDLFLVWFDYIPIVNDEEEVPFTLKFLLSIISPPNSPIQLSDSIPVPAISTDVFGFYSQLLAPSFMINLQFIKKLLFVIKAVEDEELSIHQSLVEDVKIKLMDLCHQVQDRNVLFDFIGLDLQQTLIQFFKN